MLVPCERADSNKHKERNSMPFSLKNLFNTDYEKRLVSVFREGSTYSLGLSVVVDTKTGVNYLVAVNNENAVSVTVMVDADGKPLVTDFPQSDSSEKE